MTNNNYYQKRAIAYSFLAHMQTKGTLVNGPLDIFVPLVKNALCVLYPEGTAVRGENVSEISENIKDRFEIDIPYPVLLNILKILAKELNQECDREDFRINNDGSFWIEKFIFDDYIEQVEDSKKDINEVVKYFKEFCKIYNVDSSATENDLFRFIDQNRADISFYLSHDTKRDESHSVISAQFVDFFKQNSDVYNKLRDMYLGSILTSYIEYQPKDANMSIELLLDTNFIISLLDLNTPESTKTCNLLIESCKKIGYTFTVLQDTIEETRGLLSYKSDSLNTAIIAKSINREDILNACDRLHLNSVDLDRISDNLEERLLAYNIHIIPHTEKYKNKAKYSKEYEVLKKYRNNTNAALHDAMAIIYVREKRGDKKIKEFEKVNCWFVNNAISHGNDHEGSFSKEDEELNLFQQNVVGQPETIKANDLLNIIWLSNPSIGVNNVDLIDMGLSSMVSYTLNATLPKARIIRELDENIQKYRKDTGISDKDVLRLSTRIVNRQITDIQALNELANKDSAEFATRIKEEANKQEQIETIRVHKLEQMFSSVTKAIEELREHKEKLDQRHKERETELQSAQTSVEERERQLALKQKGIEQSARDKDDIIENIWRKENKSRSDRRDKYLNEAVKKEKKKAWIIAIGLVFFTVVAFVLVNMFDTQIATCINKYEWLSLSLINWGIGILGTIVDGYFIHNLCNWYFNPSFANNKKLSVKIPEELKEITLEDFVAANKT